MEATQTTESSKPYDIHRVDGVGSGIHSGTRLAVKPKTGFGPAYIINAVTGCWNWRRSVDSDGYGYFRSNRRIVKAHVHYWTENNGPVPNGLELDHKCENRRCCNPDHLEPVSHAENCRRGALVKTSMTLEKANEMRALRAAGVSYVELAARFNVSKSLVAQIVTNRCWKSSPPIASQPTGGQSR